ncbi:MAG: hypothetical protein PF486_08125 [Prolixibacteraceae bacterium]|jgi:hypothetical protein|nr:hypothetical protein [Prolixibacteraceae bacterium]
MTNIPINSLPDFKEMAFRENGDFVHFKIIIAGGIATSSKRVSYRPSEDQFLIIHEIDETYEEIFSYQLAERSNIIEAINKKALFLDE